MTPLRQRLRELIEQNGPLTVAQYMALALHDPQAGYYATRPAIGGAGDFITAPETSQMFGEIVGLWLAESWRALGAPDPFHLVELGPGTGVLMADIWRAAGRVPQFQSAARVTLAEISAPLRGRQAETLRALDPRWIDRLEDLPEGPCLLVGNEFLDCLPVRQFVRADAGWRERVVGVRDGALVFGLAPGPPSPDLAAAAPQAAPVGAVWEIAPALETVVAAIAARLTRSPGRALFIDYGAADAAGGDTLQAVSRHAKVDPLADPGAADLTAHVDFARLVSLAQAAGLDVRGPVPQGVWLTTLGLADRAKALAAKNPERADAIERQRRRLVDDDGMGMLFQVVCLSSPDAPPAAGFA